MNKSRLEAFSDGVIAVIITIMVLSLRVPERTDLQAIAGLASAFFTYAVSFVFVGIYWNNHHHLLHAVAHIDGTVLWANLHLLFWLSLVPFITAWAGANATAPLPTALYGAVLLLCGIAWLILQRALVKLNGRSSALGRAIGADLKGKASALLYLMAVGLAFVHAWIAYAIYVLVALMWLIPDRRIERAIRSAERDRDIP